MNCSFYRLFSLWFWDVLAPPLLSLFTVLLVSDGSVTWSIRWLTFHHWPVTVWIAWLLSCLLGTLVLINGPGQRALDLWWVSFLSKHTCFVCPRSCCKRNVLQTSYKKNGIQDVFLPCYKWKKPANGTSRICLSKISLNLYDALLR